MQVVVVPMDPWSRGVATDGSFDFVTFDHYVMAPNGEFLVYAGSVDSTGNATLQFLWLSESDASIHQRNSIVCDIESGAYFVQKRHLHPELLLYSAYHSNLATESSFARNDGLNQLIPPLSEQLTTYHSLKAALVGGQHVTFVGFGERCENPFPGFRVTQAGTYHLQFYVEVDETYETFTDYVDVERALLRGQELQAVLLFSGCEEISRESTRQENPFPEWSAIGVRLLEWGQFADETGHRITFSQSVVAGPGLWILQEYSLRDTEEMTITLSVVDSISGNVTAQILYSCPLTTGLLMTAPTRPSQPLVDFFAVYEGMLTGRPLEVRMDFRDCSDPTGSGLDFTGTIAGAYLRDTYLESPDCWIFFPHRSSCFLLVSRIPFPHSIPEETYETFTDYVDVERALLRGQELQAVLLFSGCEEISRESEYSLRDTEEMTLTLSVVDSISGNVTALLLYSCPLTTGLLMTAPTRPSQPLVDFFAVYEGMLTGRHLEVRMDFRDCSDPTGSGLDFTGTIAGAYLRDTYLESPDSPTSSIYSTVNTLVTDWTDGEGVAYQAVTMRMNRDNTVVLYPSYYTDVDGVWTNVFGDDFYLECAFGTGFFVFGSSLE
ncbi:unnamed protein product [Darwinula stevensoni]|uniref:Uncharacterized protein n=2 Tax=Darwinula stevensoni TaxID=69355 RepID=A0A7R8XEP6_9CRUS|nr:unnamed protein product [Darwinula stevensoni]CAG0889870.1 unnamed protein product [Darwinula stevensoni]